MKIVPFNALEAKVEIPSSDIGFVRKGMPADISIDSFPATISAFSPEQSINWDQTHCLQNRACSKLNTAIQQKLNYQAKS